MGKGSLYCRTLEEGRPIPRDEVDAIRDGMLGSSVCNVDAKRSGSEGAESNEFIGLDEAEKGSTAGIVGAVPPSIWDGVDAWGPRCPLYIRMV